MTDFINQELEKAVFADFTNYMSATNAEEIKHLAKAKNVPANILHNFLQAIEGWTEEQHKLFLANDIEGLKVSLGVDKLEILNDNSFENIPDEINCGEILNFASQEESDAYWLSHHKEAQEQVEAQKKAEEEYRAKIEAEKETKIEEIDERTAL